MDDDSMLNRVDRFFSQHKIEKYKTDSFNFFSSTQALDVTHSDPAAYLPNTHSGLLDLNAVTSFIELEKLGSDVQIVTGTEDIYKSPYQSALRPVSKISILNNVRYAVLVSAEFFAYDAKKNGSTYQTAAVNTEIESSLTAAPYNTNNGYVQSRFFMGIMPSWEPNFFRPSIRINDIQIFESQDSGFYSNLSDKSIGENLPFKHKCFFEFENGIRKIDVSAIAGQIVKTGGNTYLKRYPLLCRLLFAYGY